MNKQTDNQSKKTGKLKTDQSKQTKKCGVSTLITDKTKMKTIKTIILVLALLPFSQAHAQDSPLGFLFGGEGHNGLQISAYIGGAGGNVEAKGDSFGTAVFKGTTIHFLMHAGYAVDD